ncbi:hypothetical protein CEXT_152911 [Caerostris extrusa]|uniref:Uncharacterized protein n=1 Tax=Caerostris extrusa TaxID=172846 RepID=A0AAV4U0I3_CAEEX|nr:hypothetical protein CEXT_152911 [Caerostris extrusa]
MQTIPLLSRKKSISPVSSRSRNGKEKGEKGKTKQKKKKEIYCSIAGLSGRPQTSSMVNSSLIDDGYLLFYCIDISADSWMDRSSGMLTFTQAVLEEACSEMVEEKNRTSVGIKMLVSKCIDK